MADAKVHYNPLTYPSAYKISIAGVRTTTTAASESSLYTYDPITATITTKTAKNQTSF